MNQKVFLATALCCFLPTLLADPAGLPEPVRDTQNPKDKPLSPQAALEKLTVPDGFRVTLFAGEPDLLQPIAFDFDDRGRLWVVECFSYPDFKVEDRDRITIFADHDGDGRFDERKVFYDRGRRLSGIALGFGGVWVCSVPELLFIPDTNRDDRPDGEPVVILDGWTRKAGHNLVNGLAWGPDGWLYGRHGITSPSFVGRPGDPEGKRTQLSCSIWRYHPTRYLFEVVAHGTTNPWGLDWDDHGQAFFSNNVIGHLWHLVPGAHYRRMFGQDFNPHIYELMTACSDHLHWAGSEWTKSRGGQGEHDVLGGGHSHAGAMIYLGDNWPETYRSTLMMANIHGNRLLYDRLERHGSGYMAKHGANFLMANDPWFRGVSVQYGPDGGVYVSDWNDLGECHDSDGAYRSSGRIYKITYGQTEPVRDLDLNRLSNSELVRLQSHRNDWYVRRARRILQERRAGWQLRDDTRSGLAALLTDQADVTRQLRALWALHVTGGVPEELSLAQLEHPSEHMRWWAVQLLCESHRVPANVLHKLVEMARKKTELPFVRLALASAMQRLPLEDRWELAAALLGHAEDGEDANLPLMIWYGIEPLVTADRDRALKLAAQSRIPKVRQFISRRVAALAE